MRKGYHWRQLGRTHSHKMAMLRNMVTSLIDHERIVTTTAKAKELKRFAERLITFAKKPDPIHARRLINQVVRTDQAATKLLNVLGPRYKYREGGYTRILKLARPRAGDNADMAAIEYVDRPGEIRAARPPAALRARSLEQALADLTVDTHAVQMQRLQEERQQQRQEQLQKQQERQQQQQSAAVSVGPQKEAAVPDTA